MSQKKERTEGGGNELIVLSGKDVQIDVGAARRPESNPGSCDSKELEQRLSNRHGPSVTLDDCRTPRRATWHAIRSTGPPLACTPAPRCRPCRLLCRPGGDRGSSRPRLPSLRDAAHRARPERRLRTDPQTGPSKAKRRRSGCKGERGALLRQGGASHRAVARARPALPPQRPLAHRGAQKAHQAASSRV
jgi:hypothetical protein